MSTQGKIAFYLGALIASVVIGRMVGTGAVMQLVGVTALVIASIIALRPQYAVYVYIVVFFMLDRLVDLGMLPSATRWVPDIVLIVLVVRVLAEFLLTRRPLRWPQPATTTIFLLFVVLFVSAMLNLFRPAEFLVGFRYYFRYPLLFLTLVNIDLPRAVVRRAFLVLFMVALAQLPLTAMQFAQSGSPVDQNSGSFIIYGGGDLLFFCLCVAAVGVVHFVTSERRPLAALVAPLLAFVPPLLAGTRIIQYLGPLVLLSSLLWGLTLRGVRKGSTRGILILATVGLLVFAAAQTAFWDDTVAPQLFRDTSSIQTYEYAESAHMGRFAALRYSFQVLTRDAVTFFVGLGPGSLGESSVAYGRAYKVLRSGVVRSQFNSSLLEVGVIGVGVMLASLVSLVITLRRHARASVPGLLGSARQAMPIIVLVYGFMFFYSTVWLTNVPSFLVWAGLALMMRAEPPAEVAEREEAELEAARPDGVDLAAIVRRSHG